MVQQSPHRKCDSGCCSGAHCISIQVANQDIRLEHSHAGMELDEDGLELTVCKDGKHSAWSSPILRPCYITVEIAPGGMDPSYFIGVTPETKIPKVGECLAFSSESGISFCGNNASFGVRGKSQGPSKLPWYRLETGAVLGVCYDPFQKYVLFFAHDLKTNLEGHNLQQIQERRQILTDLKSDDRYESLDEVWAGFLGGFHVEEEGDMVFCISAWMDFGQVRLDVHAQSPVPYGGLTDLPECIQPHLASGDHLALPFC